MNKERDHNNYYARNFFRGETLKTIDDTSTLT